MNKQLDQLEVYLARQNGERPAYLIRDHFEWLEWPDYSNNLYYKLMINNQTDTGSIYVYDLEDHATGAKHLDAVTSLPADQLYARTAVYMHTH